MGRDPRVQHLVRAETERGARARRHPFDRPRRARADRVVEPGNVADRAVGELGGERPIPLVEARASEGRREDPVRVRALVGDPADHLERDLPGARAHPRCSPRLDPRAARPLRARTSACGRRGRPRRARRSPGHAWTRRVAVPRDRSAPGLGRRRQASAAPGRVRSRARAPSAAPDGTSSPRPARARTRGPAARSRRRVTSSRSSARREGASARTVAAAWSWDRGSTVPSSNPRSVSTRSGAPSSASRAPERPRVLVGLDRRLDGREDRPGVQPLVHQHHGHAGDLVALQDRALHRRRASPPRQEREVDVHRAEPRDVQDVGGEDLAVRDHDDRVGLQRVESVEALAVAHPIDLEERQIQRPGGVRHRRRGELRSTPRGPRRVREDELDVDVRPLRRGHATAGPTTCRCRGTRSACREDTAVSPPKASRGSAIPISIRRSCAITSRRPSSSSRSM